MTVETNAPRPEPKARKVVYNNASAPVYGLGLIGAWVYYLSTATSFWVGVLGILKGVVWPAMLVYEALKYLNM